jgi:septal ring factor EnvC (AmiA/AmiB activator)
MALAQEDIEQIRLLIKTTLSETPETLNANVRYELDLRERTIRVEEALKHQRELMLEGFKQMEKRFEQVDKRFEQVDKRFEQVEKRFEQVDKRFEQMDKRFEQMDKKFDQLHQEIMGLHHEIKLLMRWSFGTLLAIGGLIVAVLRLAP